MAKRPPRKATSGPTRIGDILQQFLKEAMPKNLGDEIRVFGQWPLAVGPEIAKQAEPKGFKHGILFVETRHPVWTMELTGKRHLIRKRINEALGEEVVKEIKFSQARL
jgi:predicted nucleic acid-binding Zn ribbon protein